MKKENPFYKYKNPDSRCNYPFDPEPLGYCWGYSSHIDGDKQYENILDLCQSCDLWKPNRKKVDNVNPR